MVGASATPPPSGEAAQLKLHLEETIRLLREQLRLYDDALEKEYRGLENDDDDIKEDNNGVKEHVKNPSSKGTNAWILDFTSSKLQDNTNQSTWWLFEDDDKKKLDQIFTEAGEIQAKQLTLQLVTPEGLDAEQDRDLSDVLSSLPVTRANHDVFFNVSSLLDKYPRKKTPRLALALSEPLSRLERRELALGLLIDVIAQVDKEEEAWEDVDSDGDEEEENVGGQQTAEAKAGQSRENNPEQNGEAREAEAEEQQEGGPQTAAAKAEQNNPSHNGAAREAAAETPANPPCPLPLLRDLLVAAAAHASYLRRPYCYPSFSAEGAYPGRYPCPTPLLERAIALSVQLHAPPVYLLELRFEHARSFAVYAERLRALSEFVEGLEEMETAAGGWVSVVLTGEKGEVSEDYRAGRVAYWVGHLLECLSDLEGWGEVERRFREWRRGRWEVERVEGPERKRVKQ